MLHDSEIGQYTPTYLAAAISALLKISSGSQILIYINTHSTQIHASALFSQFLGAKHLNLIPKFKKHFRGHRVVLETASDQAEIPTISRFGYVAFPGCLSQ